MKQVLDFIQKQQLIEKGDHVIAGVSGGADSVYLLFVLLKLQEILGFQISIVHVNHNIRGEEAARDQKYVEELCRQNHLPCYCYSYQVCALAKEEKISVEEAGRKVRYQALEDCRIKQGANKIALAHHQNDQAETVLYHLARGTGLAGLAAMTPKREYWIRPLLCMNRQEIEHDLNSENIKYLTDSTNASDDYMRNRIRHHLIPFLEQEVNPQAVSHIADTAKMAGEVQEYMEMQARNVAGRLVEKKEGQPGLFLSLNIKQEPKIMQKYVIRLCIRELRCQLKDITQQHIEMIQGLLHKNVGRQVHLPGGLYAIRQYDHIYMQIGHELVHTDMQKDPMEDAKIPLIVPGKIQMGNLQCECRVETGAPEIIPEKTYTKWLDYGKIEGTLVLRKRCPGDYLIVNQAGGKRKLKDYFIDQKIPQNQRDNIWLLATGSEIIWVIGYRISEAYKVNSKTKETLKIQILGGTIHE